ncbi:MAG: DUF3224 domain-containing protein [bacterium]
MAHEAHATYVNLSADEQPSGDASAGATISQGHVHRRFEGGIVGESAAAVLIARGTPERLGYVATDRFSGRVGDRTGDFVFQHGGTIDRGTLTPFGYVVPGSGTDELAGLTGTIRIEFIPPATHTLTLHYDFER